MVLERDFQKRVKKRISERFEGSVVFKTDTSQNAGIPDLCVLQGHNWALLELKRKKNAKFQPNQEYFVKKYNDMSFSAVVYPDNLEEVLDEMERVFKSRR